MRVLAELQWMKEQGHWVALAAHPRSAIAREAEAARIPFRPLYTHKALLPFEIVRLAAWLAWNRVEVVNTHSSNDAWLAGLAARLAVRPILIRSRHIEVDYPNRFFSGLAYRVLPEHILTTSQRIADRLVEELRVPPGRITSIPTGVDLRRFRLSEIGTLHQMLGLPTETALVGMISVLRSWKGHATLLDAAATLLSSAPRPIHFVIAGDGPGREELENKILREPWKNHVTLLGHRTDVPQVLASLDVLVLPSFAHEGIPQIILQAQAMGRAVVATTVGGIPEVVEDGVNGLLVPPRDPVALAEKIQLLLGDPVLRSRLGQAARQEIEKAHTLDAMGERLLGLYASLGRKKN